MDRDTRRTYSLNNLSKEEKDEYEAWQQAKSLGIPGYLDRLLEVMFIVAEKDKREADNEFKYLKASIKVDSVREMRRLVAERVQQLEVLAAQESSEYSSDTAVPPTINGR